MPRSCLLFVEHRRNKKLSGAKSHGFSCLICWPISRASGIQSILAAQRMLNRVLRADVARAVWALAVAPERRVLSPPPRARSGASEAPGEHRATTHALGAEGRRACRAGVRRHHVCPRRPPPTDDHVVDGGPRTGVRGVPSQWGALPCSALIGMAAHLLGYRDEGRRRTEGLAPLGRASCSMHALALCQGGYQPAPGFDRSCVSHVHGGTFKVIDWEAGHLARVGWPPQSGKTSSSVFLLIVS